MRAIGSYAGQLSYGQSDISAALATGATPSVPGWHFLRHAPENKWQFERHSTAIGQSIAIPNWAPLLLTALPTAYLWRRDWNAWRRADAGKCSKCNYDLSGLAANAACPECNAGKG